MREFKLRFGRFAATLDAAESKLLTGLVDQVRVLLAQRHGDTPDDPLAGLTGLAVGPDTAPDDPALARLLPDFFADDAGQSAGMRMLREPEVVAAKDDAAAVVLASLPPDGGTVRLDEPTARSWLITLNDLRLVLGVRLSITDDDAIPMAAAADQGGPEHALYVTYGWLSAIQESLVTVMLEAQHGKA